MKLKKEPSLLDTHTYLHNYLHTPSMQQSSS